MQREKVNQLDTAKLKGSDFRISREAYLENYGFNDTARALINLHFDKRRVAKVLKYSNLGFLAFIRVAGTEPTSPIDPEPETKYKPWVIPALVAAGGVAIYSFVRLDAWSLKRLLKTLYTYEKTGSLPDRLRTRLTSTHFEP